MAEKGALAAKLESPRKRRLCRVEEEAAEAKADVQRLQRELRDAKVRGPSNDAEQELLDTYEEVMREEMRAMKEGYERRIEELKRAAKTAHRKGAAEGAQRASELHKKALLAESKARGLEAALDASRERVVELLSQVK